MFMNERHFPFLLVFLLWTATVSAQQQNAASQAAKGKIVLDVVVTQKSGPPVSGLEQQDFSLFDNKVPQTITSFEAVDGRKAPIDVVLVVDAVNTDYERVAYARDQTDKFLRADGGRLAHPSTLAILTDTGISRQDFSSDGNTLAASLDQSIIGLRNVTRAGGLFGETEIFQISINGLRHLVNRETPRLGRKVIVWVSPGWPLLSGPEVGLSPKDQEQLFSEIVGFSTQFLQGRITLYSIDPLGMSDAGSARTNYWNEFVKGVSKPSQVRMGDLALEVLATQSGGLAVNSSNNIADQLQKCLADLGTYYEISFDPPPGDKPNEYHNLEIRMAKRGLVARTRQGYYSQPRY